MFSYTIENPLLMTTDYQPTYCVFMHGHRNLSYKFIRYIAKPNEWISVFCHYFRENLKQAKFCLREDKAKCIEPYKSNSVSHYWPQKKFSVGTILKVFCGYNIALTLYKSTAIINCM